MIGPKQAQLECANIACHLRNMLSVSEREEAGIEGRDLHIQVMRALSFLKDQIGSGTVPASAELVADRAGALAPKSPSHSSSVSLSLEEQRKQVDDARVSSHHEGNNILD